MGRPDDLEPLEPAEAVQMYKQQRRDEVSVATLQSLGYRLKHFVKWCKDEDISNLNDVGGRDIHRIRLWRSEQVNQTTLKSQMDTLRVFIRFCESIDGCRDGLADSIQSLRRPETGPRERRGPYGQSQRHPRVPRQIPVRQYPAYHRPASLGDWNACWCGTQHRS